MVVLAKKDRCGNIVTRKPLNHGSTITSDPSNEENIACDPLSNECSGSQTVWHIRTTVPLSWGVALDHITADLRITKSEALRRSVAMFLRFHGRGQGIPEPLPLIERRQ